MPPADAIVFRCIQVRQPIGAFYVGAIAAEDLLMIAKADIRRMMEGKARDVEEFSGIQRELSQSRIKELKEYVGHVDASFPTSIILHVSSAHAAYDDVKSVMAIDRLPDVAQILDGQHRIAGLRDYRGPAFELNAAIFVDMDPEEQALLFATINLKQTRVSKSLAYDLYDFARTRSPQKTAHNVARLLNTKDGSPFYRRIKILGEASKGREETLTQAAVVDRVLPLITHNAAADRDTIKRGHELPPTSEAEGYQLIFREMFRLNRDAEIARVLWDYFEAVAKRWPAAWDAVRPGHVLNRTTGFAAFMRLLPEAYRLARPQSGLPDTAMFSRLMSKVQLGNDDFNRERYLPGTSGVKQLHADLAEAIRD
jgi:DGQHR domain-containing protein